MKKEDLKIVFLGTPEFAVESLDRLRRHGCNIAAVITMPDKPAGRGHKLLQSPVKQYAVEHGLRLLQPVSLKDPEFLAELAAIGADLFIVIAFRMLPRAVWEMPPMGTFNLHASLLPRYRGAAPINRAVMNGEHETGVTTFMLKHEIDTGDILRREAIEIGENEDAGSVHDRLMALGADLVIDTVDHLLAGDLKPLPQDELLAGIEPTPAPKIFSEDMIIDWTHTAREVHNHIRGLAPYPAARATLVTADGRETPMKILKSRLCDKSGGNPGTIATDGDRLLAACGDGRCIEILALHPAGRKPMDAASFMRGTSTEGAFFATK